MGDRMTNLLTDQIARQILDFIQLSDVSAGQRLVERKLATKLKVSRTPVRHALQLLEKHGFAKQIPSGGFELTKDWRSLPALPQNFEDVDNDLAIYERIAASCLENELPERISENELVRRFNSSKGQITRILNKIATEGWAERLPGHGWQFLPMLTSMQSYRDSYNFRITIEPAAILESTFILNTKALLSRREEQQNLLDGQIWKISNSALFDLNANLHETIIECSNNSFYIDSLKRIDKLRRLIDYRQTLDRQLAIGRIEEHVQLLNLLLTNKLKEASIFMREHLSAVSAVKAPGHCD